MAPTYVRFDGEIYGFGTASGDRFVVGRWLESPLGAFADVMHESSTGVRTLHAPDDDVAELIRGTYEFDGCRIGAVRADRVGDALTLETDDLSIVVGVGARTGIGRLLRMVPAPLARSRRWAGLVDPVVRIVFDGVRTKGTAGNGRVEWYGATDQHRILHASAVLDGTDLGELADVWPPVRFGFSSTPRQPSVAAVSTTIRL